MSDMDKIYPNVWSLFDQIYVQYHSGLLFSPSKSLHDPHDYATSFRGPVDDGSAELTEWTWLHYNETDTSSSSVWISI